jgi:hypothetical protein
MAILGKSDSMTEALRCLYDAPTAIYDGLKTGPEYLQNTSRMPMLQDLSIIIKNHHDYRRVSPRIFMNHPDFLSRADSGQTS